MVHQNFIFIILLAYVEVSKPEESWTGKWFPSNPETSSKSQVVNDASSTSKEKTWDGKWFPNDPSNEPSSQNSERDRIMGIPNKDCDDGKTNLATDFDIHSYDHSKFYICLEPTYTPSLEAEPVQISHEVNKFYTPVHKCMNETLVYDQRIPTLGYHRPLWAKYGEYTFLPPQRWLHNLEHGAIVALYHPCANKNLIGKLKKIVKSCLFRHVITPFRGLTSEKPFAVVAWATSFEFSVVNEIMIKDFIRKYAKTGPEKVSSNGQYSEGIIEPSEIVSEDDADICPKAI